MTQQSDLVYVVFDGCLKFLGMNLVALSIEQKIELVKSYGFHLQSRNLAIMTGTKGSLMLANLPASLGAWAVVGDDQASLLDLAIKEHAMTRYMHGEWQHIFKEGDAPAVCRLLLDTVDQVVLRADVLDGDDWTPLNKEWREDLLESLNHNDVWSNADFSDEFEKTNERPHWA